MKKPLKNKRRIFAVVMGIVWGIMIVALGISIYRIYNYAGSYNYYPKVANMSDTILSGNYSSIYSRMESLDDLEDHPEYNEMQAVHDYVEAATHYKMYSENGFEAEAKKYLARMSEARERMGDILFCADGIDEKLNLN